MASTGMSDAQYRNAVNRLRQASTTRGQGGAERRLRGAVERERQRRERAGR